MNVTLDNPTLQSQAANANRNWQPVERTFQTFDGMELLYRAWLPEAGGARIDKALILFHRGHEHSGRWQEFVETLNARDTAVFAYDARGHGRSPGERGWAPDFATLVKDAEIFARHLVAEHGVNLEDTAVIAHSVGAVVATAWVHDYAPPIRALVLATPAFKVKLYVPLAIPTLRALQKVKKRSFVKSYVRAKMLTHDPAQAAVYDADPLISKQIAVNILLDLHDASNRLIADAGAIATPTLLLGAGSDWVVKNSAIAKFHDRLSSPTKELHVFPAMGHSIFHEADRQQVIDRVRDFLDRQFSAPPADRIEPLKSYTRREYEKLSKPLSAICPKGWMFKVQTLSMKTACKLSDGIRLGWRTGFDSGQSLDYVYRNRSRGFTPVGKLIDHFYLNAVGWRGIRQRRAHIDQALRESIGSMLAQHGQARILDIAAGPGRYVLETLAGMRGENVSALLRDRSLAALEQGRQLASALNLTNVNFEPGDAFSTTELAAIALKPNIAIVSGLYELFPDNALIEASLTGLAQALPSGGLLIYTNQPWHPQLEMIARTLINRDGQPWVMRRRTQAEMDHLVKDTGFEKQSMEIDRWGVFTVSVARKV